MDNLFIGKVNYINYNSEIAKLDSNLLGNFMWKHFSFKDEHEIRILHCSFQLQHDLEKANETNSMSKAININPETTIEKIYVNGYATEWYYETVKAITKKYLPDTLVIWPNFRSPVFY